MEKLKIDQEDGDVLDILMDPRDILKSLRTSRKDISTLFFWFQGSPMLLFHVMTINFHVSLLTGATTSN